MGIRSAVLGRSAEAAFERCRAKRSSSPACTCTTSSGSRSSPPSVAMREHVTAAIHARWREAAQPLEAMMLTWNRIRSTMAIPLRRNAFCVPFWRVRPPHPRAAETHMLKSPLPSTVYDAARFPRRGASRAGAICCRALLFGSLLLMPTACASGYRQFYTPVEGITPELIARDREAPPPETPIVEHASRSEEEKVVDAHLKRGFVPIGSSFFNSGRSESESAAICQGQDVCADLVVVFAPRYTGSTTSMVPITTPTTSTSYSTASATAYGSGGTVNAYGSGTTTTYGSRTTYMPMTVHRSDYGAIYFVRKRFAFGAFFRDLNDNERQDLQSNKGAEIRLIADGTPAFDADILPGDVLTSIDGSVVASAKDAQDLLHEKQGRLVTLSLVRKGTKIEKAVQLRTNPGN